MPKQKKRTYKTSKPKPKRQKTRGGYSSVARTRGAAVTGEMKYFDTLKNAVAIPNSTDWTATELDPTTYNTLVCPIVGSGVDQRIGKSIKVMKIKIRGSIICAAQTGQATEDEASVIRLILHQDKQTNSTQAQGEDVMANAADGVMNPLSFQNINNFGRFRVLKDKTWQLQQPGTVWNGANVLQSGLAMHFKWTIKFRYPVVIRFNATNGGTVADIVDNSFHIIGTTSSVSLVPKLYYQSRVCYKE